MVMRIELERSEVEHPKGLELWVKGFNHHPYEGEDHGSQVFLEVYEGRLLVHVWDGKSEDPTQTIVIDPLVVGQDSTPALVAA
jgi:hypothetical protein